MSNTGKEKIYRPPIVTVMGHVDHGKTSILDAIRRTNVHAAEFGGITQHIGAYQIVHNGKKITFIDTPGHAAFKNMRMRGGKAADIVVLVVAADDGVQPQTKEAIQIIHNSKVTPIVAINKIDVPGVDTKKIKQQLAAENILVEEWGGEVLCVEISAKNGTNINKLLDSILAVADMKELRYLPESDLECTIVESRKDKRKGVVVEAIVMSGTLRLGDKVTASGFNAKIKSLFDEKGNSIKEALPGDPVEIMGFVDVPNVGDLIVTAGSELAQLAIDESRTEIIGKDTKRVISVVLRADTQGTLEAVKANLSDMVSSAVGVTFSLRFLLSGTGEIIDSDVELAHSADGVVLGFNVKTSPAVEDLAKDLNVKVKTYKTIYELLDEAKELLEGSAVSEEEKIKGRAQLLKTFVLPSGDVVLGCRVIAGSFKVNDRVAIYDIDPGDAGEFDEPIYRTSIRKIKINKDEVESVKKGSECGFLLKSLPENELKNLWLEVY